MVREPLLEVRDRGNQRDRSLAGLPLEGELEAVAGFHIVQGVEEVNASELLSRVLVIVFRRTGGLPVVIPAGLLDRCTGITDHASTATVVVSSSVPVSPPISTRSMSERCAPSSSVTVTVALYVPVLPT